MQSNLDALKPAALWVPVKIVPKPGKPGKTDKVPCNLDGYQVDAQNPSNCMDFWSADAIRHFLTLRAGESTGVGLVIRPECGLFCVDLDDCIQGDRLSDLALGMIEALPGALMERSHSGRGLHLWGYAPTMDPEHRTRSVACPALEVYTRGRFILVTEDFCGGWLDDHSNALGAMVTALLGAPVQHVAFEWTDTGLNDHLSDEEVIARVRSHRIRTPTGGYRTGAALWDGDADKLGQHYPSSTGSAYDGSGADLALATLLMTHTGNNADRSWRLLTESGLARGKHYRDDYRQWTIERAYRPDLKPALRPETLPWSGGVPAVPRVPVAPSQTVYIPSVAPSVPVVHNVSSAEGVRDAPVAIPKPSVAEPAPSAALKPWSVPRWQPDALLGRAELEEHFAGCTYVADRDQIYAPDGKFYAERQFNAMWGGNGLMFVMSADNKITRKAWEAFHSSSQFETPKVTTSCFCPDQPAGALIDGQLNTWRPVHVRMIPGDPEPWLSLLRKQIPDERDQRILLSWMAACVQHREKKFRWSPYIQGLPGNGKTTHMSVIDYCIGAEYSCRPRSDMLGKQFNSMLDRKLFAGVDDVHVTMKMWAVLKPMITETVSEVERKGVDSSTVRNGVVKYLLTGNDKNGLPITRDNRRIAPFFTAHQELEDLERDGIDEESLAAMYEWLQADGYAIVAHYLMHYAIDPEFNPAGKCQRAPFTSSTEEAIRVCRPAIERHLQESIEITKEIGAGGTIGYLALQMFYRRHSERLPDIDRLKRLLKDFGFSEFDVLETGPQWRRPVPVVPRVPVS